MPVLLAPRTPRPQQVTPVFLMLPMLVLPMLRNYPLEAALASLTPLNGKLFGLVIYAVEGVGEFGRQHAEVLAAALPRLGQLRLAYGRNVSVSAMVTLLTQLPKLELLDLWTQCGPGPALPTAVALALHEQRGTERAEPLCIMLSSYTWDESLAKLAVRGMKVMKRMWDEASMGLWWVDVEVGDCDF